MGALRTDRDRAMVQAMVLGGLRRCEVLGLRLEDLRLGEWRVFISEGKGGHQRLVPVSPTFFATVARYMNSERPGRCDERSVFVALERTTSWPAAVDAGISTRSSGLRVRGPVWSRDLPRAAPHLLHPAARGGHVDRGAPGPGRAPLDRVDPGLSASRRGLAGR